MEAWIVLEHFTSLLKVQVVGALAKWGHHLFMGIKRTLYNHQRFLASIKFSRNPYINDMYMLYTRVLMNSLEYSTLL